MSKSRSLAVVLAALFMVCASFAVLSDEANAESGDATISGADLVDALGVGFIEEPAECESLPDELGASYQNKTFVVENGANITLSGDSTTFDGCTLYFKGAFHIAGKSKIILKGDYVVAFNGITLDAAGVFGKVELSSSTGVNVDGADGKYNVFFDEETRSSIKIGCDIGSYEISSLEWGKGHIASFAYSPVPTKEDPVDIATGFVEIASVKEVDAECSYDNIIFNGNFKTKVYSLGYQVSQFFNDAEVSAMKASAEADSKYIKTIDVGEFKITLDSKAILALEDAGATFSVGPAGDLNERQLSAAGNRPVYTVSIGDVHDFGKGTVTVSLPYALGANEDASNLYVGYISESGKIEKMPTTYENGVVIFTTNHLSDYGIFYGSFSEDDDAGANIFFYAAFAVAIVLLIVAIVPNFMKKE